MIKNNYLHKYNKFRKDYQFFIYEKFEITSSSKALEIVFFFNLDDKHYFYPTIKIPFREFYKNYNFLNNEIFEKIIFNIGMIELISYWKSACPKKIIIKPFKLSQNQINFWKKVYFNGLGEFFYLNSIEANMNDFCDIISDSERDSNISKIELDNSVIVPIGGGKDSVVTLEILKQENFRIIPMIVNPRKASIGSIIAANYEIEDIIEVQRTIHPRLLELNEKGFLNGHTPFSAMLAFLNLSVAYLSNSRNIALSNESSANEATIENTNINHQYSKSYEFESDFRNYVENYISPDFNYFSFLRPVSEIQIGKLFSKFPKYFNDFKSCNVGSKSDVWCGKCPKCLFTYIILSPFINQQTLCDIFDYNLFDNKELKKEFDELCGIADIKPFECVGTVNEVNLALCEVIENYTDTELPFLLEYYSNSQNFLNYRDLKFNDYLKEFEDHHFLEEEFEKILKQRVNA
ncbi:hypothetical protein ACFLQ5_00065 [Bacteroidota bacterium]